MLTGDVVEAYLSRLGVEAEPPSVAALGRLHRAHVERVPYETVWIHEGQRWTTDPVAAAERIAYQRRGGYCYHLNGAFGRLLATLGYQVSRHVGGVHGDDGPTADGMANHLVLLVDGLPDERQPDGRWYIDVGLGDALHDPLPLAAGTYEQDPFRFGLGQRRGDDDAAGDWHFHHDPAGSFVGMTFRDGVATADAFETKHEWLSTSPESGFVRVCTAQRRTPSGVDVLRGLLLTAADGTVMHHDPGDQDRWFETVDDLGVRVRPEHRARLWPRVVAAHEAHLAAD